jgi:DUF438 domain-containing protein
MISVETCLAILNTVSHVLVFVDNDHVIRYLNKSAKKRYYETQGRSDLIGKSILDCHNEKSCNQIVEDYKRLKAGENEIVRIASKIGRKFSMVAVRDADGGLLGYYEKSEKISDTN